MGYLGYLGYHSDTHPPPLAVECVEAGEAYDGAAQARQRQAHLEVLLAAARFGCEQPALFQELVQRLVLDGHRRPLGNADPLHRCERGVGLKIEADVVGPSNAVPSQFSASPWAAIRSPLERHP